MDSIALLATLLLVLLAEFVNGWTDAPNAIATVISTRALTPRTAIVMASLLNMAGAFTGTAVASTIGEDIVQSAAIGLETVSAAMIAIVFWGVFAWRFGIPISKSHALVAGLSGAALAAAGPSVLIWDGWSKVLLGLLLFTGLGGVCSWCLSSAIQSFGHSASPATARSFFGHLQIFSAAFVALSHGSNDGQKFMGIFSLALVLGGVLPSFAVPWWVITLCALVMGLGTSIGGMRIIRTMGFRIVPLETYQGFSAETSAASTILLASWLGIPLSTTQTIGMSIAGVGLARRRSAVNWKIMMHIVSAWFITFPVCGLLAFFIVKIINLI